MAESDDLHALVQVSTEIDESEIKLTFASQCIKAQEELVNKLKKEIQRRREIWNFMKSDNLKLETEIRNAEHELKNLMISHETIRSANVEAKKELLLSRENYLEIVERVRDGEKKYEDLWLQCKSRYESLPLAQKLIEATKKSDLLKSEIHKLENEANFLEKEIKAKKVQLEQKDREQIIQLANFFVHEVPNYTRMINEKKSEVNDMIKDIELILAEQETNKKNASVVVEAISKHLTEEVNIQVDDDWPKLTNNMCEDDTLMMPRLQLQCVEHDTINDKLDIKKVTLQTVPIKRTVSISELEKNSIKRTKADEKLSNDYISCYFNKISNKEDDIELDQNKTDNYSNRKLINILEDIKLDDNEAYGIVARVNPEKLHGVDVISSSGSKPTQSKDDQMAIDDKVNPLECEEIEEIDLTKNNSRNIIIPPTQFLDFTQENVKQSSQQEVQVIVHMSMEQTPSKDSTLLQSKSSQANSQKKVSFDLSVEEVSDDNIMLVEDSQKPVGNETENNETLNSQLDLSSVTDDNYMSIQNMILKKHNLDLSPQFVYAKNHLLQKGDSDKIVTSKFFKQSNTTSETDITNNKETGHSKDETSINQKEETVQGLAKPAPTDENISKMELVTATSSQKMKDADKPVAGLLFTHGQGIPECLDISMSTTGYEEGDADFPHCLDSSLLLSPKADLPLVENENNEIGSQEVPNFLSGFRKAGLSFFNQKPPETNADSSVQNQGNSFNFNFGGEDKKNKGLFSFFR